MSVRVMTWVWEQSRTRKAERLVLLAIADCAADDGGNAFPSMAELMRKTGLSERGVQGCIGKLVVLRELEVRRNAGPGGCNRYRVLMTPAENAPPQKVRGARRSGARTAPPAHAAPEPPQILREPPADLAPGTVIEPSVEPSEISTPPSASLAIVDRPDVEQICRHLADRIEANGSKRPTINKSWRDAARRLIDRDGRSPEQIMRAIDWCQDDDFWRSNILSMPKLREKYDQLRLAAQRNGTRNGTQLSTADKRVAAALALAAKFAEEDAS